MEERIYPHIFCLLTSHEQEQGIELENFSDVALHLVSHEIDTFLTTLLFLGSSPQHPPPIHLCRNFGHVKMSAQDMFWAAPPIARYVQFLRAALPAISDADSSTLTAAIVLLSVPGHLIGIPDLYWLVFTPYNIFTLRQLPQIWRIATNFLISGPKLGMILDPYFVFTYASQLETSASRFSNPGDFFVYLVFVCTIIVVSGKQTPSSPFPLRPRNLVLSARPGSHVCHGSWKRGRSPLHCATFVIRKS